MDGNQGLQPAHLQKDGSSGTDAGIVDWTYFHRVPVVIPRDNAVQYREEQWSPILEICHQVLPIEGNHLLHWNGVEERRVVGLPAEISLRVPSSRLTINCLLQAFLAQHSLLNGVRLPLRSAFATFPSAGPKVLVYGAGREGLLTMT